MWKLRWVVGVVTQCAWFCVGTVMSWLCEVEYNIIEDFGMPAPAMGAWPQPTGMAGPRRAAWLAPWFGMRRWAGGALALAHQRRPLRRRLLARFGGSSDWARREREREGVRGGRVGIGGWVGPVGPEPADVPP